MLCHHRSPRQPPPGEAGRLPSSHPWGRCGQVPRPEGSTPSYSGFAVRRLASGVRVRPSRPGLVLAVLAPGLFDDRMVEPNLNFLQTQGCQNRASVRFSRCRELFSADGGRLPSSLAPRLMAGRRALTPETEVRPLRSQLTRPGLRNGLAGLHWDVVQSAEHRPVTAGVGGSSPPVPARVTPRSPCPC